MAAGVCGAMEPPAPAMAAGVCGAGLCRAMAAGVRGATWGAHGVAGAGASDTSADAGGGAPSGRDGVAGTAMPLGVKGEDSSSLTSDLISILTLSEAPVRRGMLDAESKGASSRTAARKSLSASTSPRTRCSATRLQAGVAGEGMATLGF